MRFEIIEVTPEMAGKWFGKNEGNRKLREGRAASLARAMVDGKWVLTHQAVALSKKGRLLDGQHRLRAVMLANKPALMVIAFDVPDEAFRAMDAGLPRKMYERLRSDPRHTTLCSTLFRLLQSNRVPQEYETQLMVETFGPAMVKLDQVPRPKKSVIAAAPYEAAITLRMSEALLDKDDDAANRINWKLERLRRGDIVEAPPMIQSFYRQAAEGVKNSEIGVAPTTDRFVRAWVAFDPEKEATTRLQVTDHTTALLEAKAAFAEATEKVFDE